MNHDITLTGTAYGMRPVGLADVSFIAEMRSAPNSRFMHEVTATVEAQKRFVLDYFTRPHEYYFVVERLRDGRLEGLTALTDFDESRRSMQWGRTILRPDSMAAAEMATLVLGLAFGSFGCREVWGVALAENTSMLGYVRSLGFERERPLTVQLRGHAHDAVRLVLTRDRWRTHEAEVAEVARMAGRLQVPARTASSG